MSYSAQTRLRQIPVRVMPSGSSPVAGPKSILFHGRRRAVQLIALALIVLVPTTGLFRIDPIAGALVILDRQIWFSDFFLFFGLWIFLATLLVFLYSLAGTVFCGWVCPQNSVAEWANFMTRKFLGKRAEVSLDGAPVRVTASKDRLRNWILLGLCFIGASMAIALVPMLYFYPLPVVWSFVHLRPDPVLAGSLHWIYGVFVLIVLLDVTVIRHFWCRFICVYRVWQHSFKTRQTLHIAYDASRAADCVECNYCTTQCFINLDPRSTDVFDSCINCGECVDACNRMHQKQGTRGLLRFEFGERAGRAEAFARKRNNEYSMLGRSRWALPFSFLGLGMFAWGLWSYEPYHLSVDHRAALAGQVITDYQIAIANKRYREADLRVHVSGIDPRDYRLSAQALKLGQVQHQSLTLSISPQLKHGLYPVQIDVQAQDGWVGHFQFQHFAG
ncbi:MAG TPA: 4Fe-4S dicluster domain-containing protein [Burkholderiaceae bacterium]|nr:4Fe-4S dicluster domain-containing protein [Burkholderiaceae bacterium]